ncbi:DUF975 family protein [Provencibacterium massiliense]|uniref:DUF975 family protein n=1 Tax=Provencibacterium massiliense TaxID=1841868 RepID=UPI0009A74012|nr:DUF975 family protein [Provencibacterium massiliense]RGB69786.1 DUF975 family protein [Harryflintia acetispora]
MSVRSKIKSNAKKAVSQNFVKTLTVTIILFCIVLLYIVLVMMANTVIELLSSTLALPGILRGWGYVSSPAVVGASLLLQLILFSPLMVGAARWFYRLMGQEGSDVFDLFEFFSSFRQYFGSFWLELNLTLRSFLYTFLFTLVPVVIVGLGSFLVTGEFGKAMGGPAATLVGSMLLIAGVVLLIVSAIFSWIFLKRYFLARYLYSGGECTARQAIKQSVYFMRGRKTELFFFDLTFLGWFLACVLIVPFFYVAPYYMSSCALYARYLIEYGHRYQQAAPQPQPTKEFDCAPDEAAGDPEEPQSGEAQPQ